MPVPGLRERLLAKSREQDGKKLARHTKQLEELPVGTPVVIQNQTGQYPTKWDKTGVIVEVKPFFLIFSYLHHTSFINCPQGSDKNIHT